MPTYTPWTWSPAHGKHYSYLLSDQGEILQTFWSGPATSANVTAASLRARAASRPRAEQSHYKAKSVAEVQSAEDGSNDEEEEVEEDAVEDTKQPATQASTRMDSGIYTTFQRLSLSSNATPSGSQAHTHASPHASTSYHSRVNKASAVSQITSPSPVEEMSYSSNYTDYPSAATFRSALSSLPQDVQRSIEMKDRRYIQSGSDRQIAEPLDSRFRRVVKRHHSAFFVLGRVFKMLWTEPAAVLNPGKTRNSTHFSTVWLNEQAFSEIRYFVVVRNKGTFSQCIPIQTYGKKGATKPGLVMQDHGVIHTTPIPPSPLPGEHLTKYSIRVEATEDEALAPESRINYGKAYAVEHNVKVLDIGMVSLNHRYMIEFYFNDAINSHA